jgi:hypothetical protein
MTQQGRNMYGCVTIDDKTLFVRLLVISVFVKRTTFETLKSDVMCLCYKHSIMCAVCAHTPVHFQQFPLINYRANMNPLTLICSMIIPDQ